MQQRDVLREIILPALSQLGPVRPTGGGFSARCPVHGDREPSLSVGYGREQPVVIKCHANQGCEPDAILAALGLTMAELCKPREREDRPADADGGQWMPCGHTKVASYRYYDAAGQLVFGVARCDRKGNGCQGFRQWRPDPASKSGRRWSVTLPDGGRVGEGLIYQLPAVLAAIRGEPLPRNIWVCEGEKDVDRLWSLGQPATCNAGGAGKWTGAHASWLTGADVVIVADRDDAGRKHAMVVVDTLLSVARSIEVVQSPVGKDASAHLDAGGTFGTFVTVVEPKPAPPLSAETAVSAEPLHRHRCADTADSAAGFATEQGVSA